MERDFRISSGKITRTEAATFTWSANHYGTLEKMAKSQGLEHRPDESDQTMTEAEIAICQDLEKIGLADLVHCTFFRCWRITGDGKKVLEYGNKIALETTGSASKLRRW